ncbi:Transcriptional activator Myb [Grifola frondosa]|uniref:Transcriptional activator Myb n=1 Tax=Grifola frondosa TaxID=5627 RepID=A0A1C7LMJ9_GRIFR|nr:Transcriptional activator Myb [Grifola frondosa]
MQHTDECSQPRDRRPWTEEEDEKLLAAIEEGSPRPRSTYPFFSSSPFLLSFAEDPDSSPPTRWHAIAQHITDRTNKDCRKRWWAQMSTVISKGSWTNEEDERLFSAVEELGTKWSLVASRVRTRNSGQCAKRWNDALNPSIDRSGWSPEEDEQLLKAVEQQGHSWAHIARTCLPGRTGLAAKNRYNHLIRSSSEEHPGCLRIFSFDIFFRIFAPASRRSSPEISGMFSTPEPLVENDHTAASTPSSLFPLTPTAEMDDQMMNLFMNNTFGDFSSISGSPSLSFFDPMSSCSDMFTASPLFGETDLLDAYALSPAMSSHVPSHSGVGPFEVNAPSFGTPRLIPMRTAESQNFSSPLLSQQSSVADCAPHLPLRASRQPSPYNPRSSSGVPRYPDAQVTIGSVSAFPERASIQVTQPTLDPADRRVAVAVAVCDRQDIGSTVQSLSHSLTSILHRNALAGSSGL